MQVLDTSMFISILLKQILKTNYYFIIS